MYYAKNICPKKFKINARTLTEEDLANPPIDCPKSSFISDVCFILFSTPILILTLFWPHLNYRKNNDGKSHIDNLSDAFKEVLKVNCVFTSHQLPSPTPPHPPHPPQKKKKKKKKQNKNIIKKKREIFSGCSSQKLDLKPSRRIV
jgi:hypothetical protein